MFRTELINHLTQKELARLLVAPPKESMTWFRIDNLPWIGDKPPPRFILCLVGNISWFPLENIWRLTGYFEYRGQERALYRRLRTRVANLETPSPNGSKSKSECSYTRFSHPHKKHLLSDGVAK